MKAFHWAASPSRKAFVLLLGACAASDQTSDADDAGDTDDTDTDTFVPPPLTYTVEWDSQGVACASGASGGGFGAAEPISITVELGCVDSCNMESFETRCTTSLLPGLLVVSSHGHVTYYEETTTTCTATCMPLVAQCEYAAGLTEGAWGLSYSATLTWFDVPTTDVVCAADTDDL